MSKVFIQNGTGSTATLENAHNEKIPVYDTLQDAEADLANLEENQIVATNEMVISDSEKAYIRNQNLLSDWEDITIPVGSANAITMDYDGFLTGFINASNNGTVYAVYYIIDQNGVEGKDANNAAYLQYSGGVTVVFKKGDKIYKTASQGSNFAEKVRYYKQRDYTGR